jgi:hypothetical protein
MIIWFTMLIPVATAVILYKKFQHKTLWWEFLIPVVASVLLILGSKALIEHAQTRDTEYWGGVLKRAEYYEDWNERVPCTHQNSCTCNNKDGSCTSFHGYQHSYDVDYHPPYWQIIDSNRITVGVNDVKFQQLCQRFENRTFKDLGRDYHTNDGDMYFTVWRENEETLTPVTTAHTYENRVAVSDSVFNFPEVDPKDYGLFEYPRITQFYWCPSILGGGDATRGEALRKLNNWNAKLGAPCQVRMLILIFQDQPLQAGFDQESYWKGGNKNEFVVTIGVDKNNRVQWCHPFSWTEVEGLKIDVRQHVVEQEQLNLEELVDWMVPQVQKRFERKQFADFDYLTIEPPGWAIFLVFCLVGGINFGISYWVINNEHQEGGRSRFRFHHRYFS